ncbi:uncharacterized protein LY89DRAFT_536741, partial [Mollisia scopiformis]
PDAATEAASQLDNLCPPLNQNEATLDYLWSVWTLLLDIARSQDVTSEIHTRLVNILEMLWQHAK